MKWYFLGALLFCGALLADEVLENEFLKAVVSERGGKVISLVEKSTGRQLVREGDVKDGSTIGGIGKTVDVLFKNVESLALKYELARTAEDTVTATVRLAQSTLAGSLLTRTFQLPKGQTALLCRTTLQSKEQENQFALKYHNMLAFGEDTVFTLPSKGGYSVVDYERSRLDKLSAVLEIGQPWIAALGRKSGRGVGVYVNTPQQLSNMFQWNAESLEVTFSQVSLKPIAEADEWGASISIIPFAGKGTVVEVTPEYVLTKSGGKATLYFVQSLGKCNAMLDGKALGAVDAKAGSTCMALHLPRDWTK